MLILEYCSRECCELYLPLCEGCQSNDDEDDCDCTGDHFNLICDLFLAGELQFVMLVTSGKTFRGLLVPVQVHFRVAVDAEVRVYLGNTDSELILFYLPCLEAFGSSICFDQFAGMTVILLNICLGAGVKFVHFEDIWPPGSFGSQGFDDLHPLSVSAWLFLSFCCQEYAQVRQELLRDLCLLGRSWKVLH